MQLRRRRGDFDATDNALQRLKAVMHERREITPDDIAAIAKAVHQPEAAVYGVATYYGDLGMKKRGKTRVKVCKGTACFATCNDESVGWMEEALGVKLGETSADGSVSLEEVYCLGFCNAGPAVEIEGRVYGELTPERAKTLARKEAVAGGEGHEPSDLRGPRRARRSCSSDWRSPSTRRRSTSRSSHGVFAGLKKAISAMHAGRRSRRGREVRSCAGAEARVSRPQPSGVSPRRTRRSRTRRSSCATPTRETPARTSTNTSWSAIRSPSSRGRASRATPSRRRVDTSTCAASTPSRRQRFVARWKPHARRGGSERGSQGSSFSFDIDVVEGAGSYVCGEETALLRSLEGLRGMVTARPPFPAEKGLFDKPTIVNNVETLANLGWIVRHGGLQYAHARNRKEPRHQGRLAQRALRTSGHVRGPLRCHAAHHSDGATAAA